jgi:sulfoquinovose isomerase
VIAVPAEALRLVRFAAAGRRDSGGFARLDVRGAALDDPVAATFATARMAHSFGLAALLGVPGARELSAHAVDHLLDAALDREHGGFVAAVAGRTVVDDRKTAYDAAFAALAGATTAGAGIPRGAELLAAAADALSTRFWSESEGALVDSWDRAFTASEPYRGANANMHGVEAMMALGWAAGEPVWFERAARIARRLVGAARDRGWRMPEHFDADWRPDLDYNREHPADRFRPFGGTVGHWFEWSRLLLELESAVGPAEPWLRDAAVRLYAAARAGWAADGDEGFVYTLDWDGVPVVRARLHWVAAEAVAAAATLARATGDPRYDDDARRWWRHVEERFIDRRDGSWHHELAPDGSPAASLFDDKSDLYHALQAVLIAELPVACSLPARIALARDGGPRDGAADAATSPAAAESAG